jgi:hypothetical protein
MANDKFIELNKMFRQFDLRVKNAKEANNKLVEVSDDWMIY